MIWRVIILWMLCVNGVLGLLPRRLQYSGGTPKAQLARGAFPNSLPAWAGSVNNAYDVENRSTTNTYDAIGNLIVEGVKPYFCTK